MSAADRRAGIDRGERDGNQVFRFQRFAGDRTENFRTWPFHFGLLRLRSQGGNPKTGQFAAKIAGNVGDDIFGGLFGLTAASAGPRFDAGLATAAAIQSTTCTVTIGGHHQGRACRRRIRDSSFQLQKLFCSTSFFRLRQLFHFSFLALCLLFVLSQPAQCVLLLLNDVLEDGLLVEQNSLPGDHRLFARLKCQGAGVKVFDRVFVHSLSLCAVARVLGISLSFVVRVARRGCVVLTVASHWDDHDFDDTISSVLGLKGLDWCFRFGTLLANRSEKKNQTNRKTLKPIKHTLIRRDQRPYCFGCFEVNKKRLVASSADQTSDYADWRGCGLKKIANESFYWFLCTHLCLLRT